MSKLTPLDSRLAEVRQALGTHLPFSPQDYIPGLSLEGDRALWAEELTRPLLKQDDLRFLGASSTGQPLVLLAERLPWDSQFFGYGVARLNGVFGLAGNVDPRTTDYGAALEGLMAEARQRGVKYLFAQVDPRDLALMRSLGDQGFALIETRVHYHLSVQVMHYLRMPDHLAAGVGSFREATPDDIPSLTEVARQAVNPYDRFHADPTIPPADVDRLMDRWVEESVHRRFADLTVVPDVPNPRAFITYRYHKDKWARWGVNLVQAVLSVVAPECLGWYAMVGPELTRHLARAGAQYCFGKTQLTLGLDHAVHFGKGEHVFRRVL